jgi:hypothetical protein
MGRMGGGEPMGLSPSVPQETKSNQAAFFVYELVIR